MSWLHDVATGARFLGALPRLLRHPVGPDEARTRLRERLRWRERDFLTMVARAAYGRVVTPYRALLDTAGCEYGDLEQMVRRDGVEATLGALHAGGVYLTVDEFKGRRPAVRNGREIVTDPARFRNPGSVVHVPARTGASRGAGTSVPLDLAAVRDWAVNKSLAYHARGGRDWIHARWSVPGGATIAQLLLYAAFGATPVRWFSQVDPSAATLDPRYRWSARALRWGSALAGVPLPAPEHVPLEVPLPIARWMASVLAQGGTPHLATYTSAAVRVCQAAHEAGLDLRRAQFSVGGEPITRARLAVIQEAGAEGAPRYGSMEAGLIADGCLAPMVVDDHHVYEDLHAVIQPGRAGDRADVPADAILLSSLRPTAPLILLNVSLGDHGTLVRRSCGCPLEGLGWTLHLHTIRSHEKLTAAGMTFLDADVVRVLEEVLPARFGGDPTHYQLVEEEGPDGRPGLRLRVHPAIPLADPSLVAETLLTALGHQGGAAAVMERVWREANLLRVEHAVPRATPSGKILHLHSDQSHTP